jgi:hypothetical protein
MKLRIAVPALLAVFAVGGGCDLGISRTLIVHNYGLFEAEVSWTLRYAVPDDDGNETTESSFGTVDLPAGKTFRHEMVNLVSLDLEVRRKENGMILLAETYHAGDFTGPNDELEIVVRP